MGLSQLRMYSGGGNVSAFADRPDHFCEWLSARGLGCEAAFVTRATYGHYLRETLRQAMEKYGMLILRLPKLDKNRQTKLRVKGN